MDPVSTLINFKSLIPQIFKQKAGNPFSVRIDLDPPAGISNPAEFLAKFFIDLFIEGLKHLYGDESGNIELDAMTNDQFLHMKKCIQSLGFDVHLEIYGKEKKQQKLYNLGSNDPRKLDYWILTINKNDKCYSLWFSDLQK